MVWPKRVRSLLSGDVKLGFTAATLFIIVYFLWFAADGLRATFAPDDPYNIYYYWLRGPRELIRANILFFTSYYRPLGGLYYLPMYSLFGFSPLPYRLVCFALLLANLYLFYRFACLLTGDPAIAVLATLLGSYHAQLTNLYVSNSTIYDILCFLFYMSALIYYLRLRQAGRLPTGPQILIVQALYVCALNAKEMAISLPICLGIYELGNHAPSSYRPRAIAAWFCREGRTAAIGVLLTALYVAGKVLGPDSLARMPAYRPVYTLRRFFETSGAYMGELFYAPHRFSAAGTLVIWFALIAFGWMMKSKALKFCSLYVVVVLLPLYFVPPREGFVLYLPIVGWAIFLAVLLVRCYDWAARSPQARALGIRARLPVLFFLAVAVLGSVHAAKKRHIAPFTFHAMKLTWTTIQQLQRQVPRLPRGARVLFRNSPFGDNWDLYFIAKLHFHDPSLKVALCDDPRPEPRGDIISGFDYVFTFENGKLR